MALERKASGCLCNVPEQTEEESYVDQGEGWRPFLVVTMGDKRPSAGTVSEDSLARSAGTIALGEGHLLSPHRTRRSSSPCRHRDSPAAE